MHYCITEGKIDFVMKHWEDEWRIPAITQELPEIIVEEEAGQGETQPKEIQVPKRRRTGQGKTTQKNEGPTKTGTQNGKKDKMELAKEQQK
jgi:hypothetical protein